MGSCSDTIENKTPDLLWMWDRVDRVPTGNKFYQFLCIILGKREKKLTYSDIYLIIYGLNKSVLGDEKARETALKRILIIYKFLHNNKLPKDIE